MIHLVSARQQTLLIGPTVFAPATAPLPTPTAPHKPNPPLSRSMFLAAHQLPGPWPRHDDVLMHNAVRVHCNPGNPGNPVNPGNPRVTRV